MTPSFTRALRGETLPEPHLGAPCGDHVLYWQQRAYRQGYRHGRATGVLWGLGVAVVIVAALMLWASP